MFKIAKRTVASAVVVMVLATLSFTQTSYAHFDLEDSATGMKTLFHVTPGHSPVAGKESYISYDFSKSGYKSKNFTYRLTVNKTLDEEVSTLPVEVTGNVVIAKYVFPSQGLYRIVLVAEPIDAKAKSSTFSYNQRVSLGATVNEKQDRSFELTVLAVTLLAGIFVYHVSSRIGAPRQNKRKGNNE